MNQQKPLIIGLLLSGIVNAGAILHLHQIGNSPLPTIPEKDELLIEFAPPEKQMYIDTPQEIENDDAKGNKEFISDHSTKADSSKQGNETGILPESEIKDLTPQASRTTTSFSSSPIEQYQKMEEMIEKMNERDTEAREEKKIEDQTSLVEETKQSKTETFVQDPLNALKQMDVSLSPSLTEQNDLFPLPMISIGNLSVSEKGIDTFDAEGSDLGAYLKNLREKIGIRFHQMVFFHYKTNYIFESRVKMYFEITPDGTLQNMKSDFLEGDPMFKSYCETVLASASPFAPLNEKLKPFLNENGALEISFLFGYNVRETN